jgi:Zn-dependent M28 family amino/carboxypeptidase
MELDDGSGTVALLEIAQAFQKQKEGHVPKINSFFLHVTERNTDYLVLNIT